MVLSCSSVSIRRIIVNTAVLKCSPGEAACLQRCVYKNIRQLETCSLKMRNAQCCYILQPDGNYYLYYIKQKYIVPNLCFIHSSLFTWLALLKDTVAYMCTSLLGDGHNNYNNNTRTSQMITNLQNYNCSNISIISTF